MTGKVNELNVVNESPSGPAAGVVLKGAGARMDLTLFNITKDAVVARQRTSGLPQALRGEVGWKPGPRCRNHPSLRRGGRTP
jgi:hypothetical protein